MEVLEAKVNKGTGGKKLKKDAKYVFQYFGALNPDELREHQARMEENGYEGVDGALVLGRCRCIVGWCGGLWHRYIHYICCRRGCDKSSGVVLDENVVSTPASTCHPVRWVRMNAHVAS